MEHGSPEEGSGILEKLRACTRNGDDPLLKALLSHTIRQVPEEELTAFYSLRRT